MSRVDLTLDSLSNLPCQPLPFDPNAFPKLGICLSHLHLFIHLCGGRDVLKDLTTTDVCQKFLVPMTSSTKSSYCELLISLNYTEYVNTATIFISHAWKYKFLDVADSIFFHFKETSPSSPSSSSSSLSSPPQSPDHFIWFDLFSNNQHQALNLSFDYWSTTFLTAIQQFGHTVMVFAPWDDPIPLKRAWCLWELYCTVITGATFNIAMTVSSRQRFIKDILTNPTVAMNQMLGTINVERSECFKETDRLLIFDAITSSVGFSKLNSLVFSQLRDWVVKTMENELVTHPSSSRHYNALSLLYSNQGLYHKALPLSVRCLALRKETLGDRDPLTIKAMINLALLYKHQGMYVEAESLNIECLQLSREVLGERDVSTVTALNNLAFLYTKQLKYSQAKSLYLECLSIRKDLLGISHPDTLTTMNNLAGVYEGQGQGAGQGEGQGQGQGHYAEAEALYQDCFTRSQQTVGNRHPVTLSYLNNLAHFYTKRSNYQQAETLCRICLKLRREVLGEAHPETLNTLHNSAYLARVQGNYSISETLYRQCYQLRKEVLGDRHPETLTSLHNLAELHVTAADAAAAPPSVAASVAASTAVAAAAASTAAVASTSAVAFTAAVGDASPSAAGCYKKAMALFEECLRLKQDVYRLTPAHHSMTLTMKSLAHLYEKTKDFPKALSLCEQLFHLFSAHHGEHHPLTFREMTDLAKLYGKAKNVSMALEFYQRSYDLSAKLLDEKHPDRLTLMNDYGLYLLESTYPYPHPHPCPSSDGDGDGHQQRQQRQQRQQESSDLPLQLFQQVLTFRREIYGPAHPLTLITLTSLAKYYHRTSHLAVSLCLYEECLSLSRAEYGNKHHHTWQCLMNLNKFHDSHPSFPSSSSTSSSSSPSSSSSSSTSHQKLLLFKEGLELCLELHGYKHPDLLTCYGYLIDCHCNREEYGQALTYAITSLALQKELYGCRCHETIIAMNNLATIYVQLPRNHPQCPYRMPVSVSVTRRGHRERGAMEVEELYTEALLLSREVLGMIHSDTLIAMQNLGQFYLDLQNFFAAEALLVECLMGCREVFGENHSQTQEITEMLISVYKAQGDEANAALLRKGEREF